MERALIPLAGIALPMVLVPTIIILKQLGRRRELAHEERMRAMELGLAGPTADSWPALVCIALGAAMPVGLAAICWLATLSGAGDEVWMIALFVGGGGVLGGTTLAHRRFGKAKPPAEAETGAKAAAFDPDAYDVVGRRG
jgi:hypothetical protein